MALYLGNQKVSLRSGQDPTFDYGFDSNGRLVFANKNATEINNFLNYDSTYSEILDFSNLNKMEKVAVNGTSDRKMEGLKGLLVSPNAPFTGSSPQINVSYTGLSKSALVSLFESVPYNVGYTKVGNPTIVDGVASGFSADDYVRTVKNFPTSNISTLEWGCKFTTGSNVNYQGITGTGSYWGCYGFGLSDYGALATVLSFSPNIILRYPVSTIKSNSTYISKAYWNATTKEFSAKVSGDNGETWTTSSMVVSDDFSYRDSPVQFGTTQAGNFRGSIDLNNTYIKVNGVTWFRGQPTMTKTCSIVGATGTADLTQEDKNIILNKGWSLTVQ